MQTITSRHGKSTRQRRAGFSWTGIAVVLGVIVGGAILVWKFLPSSLPDQSEGPLTHLVARSNFIHELVERGEIESSATVDVRCMVRGGTVILDILPEGTMVKAGDLLATLDDSALKDQRDLQQKVVSAAEAALIQAQSTYETALIAKREYLEGTFLQEQKVIEGEIFIAEENLRRAEDNAKYSAKLVARGIATAETLAADQFAVANAGKALEIAKGKLHVLREFTKAKQITTLDAAIKSAEANLGSQKAIFQSEQEKLTEILDQMALCKVVAPQDGEVTYPAADQRDSNEIVIKEGTAVRERQVMIRLPDPKRMQVNAKVNESKLRLIKEGMLATIRVEALNDAEMTGVVKRVSTYANRSRWSSSSVKDFSVYIDIDNPPVGLRSGSSAEVKIRVNQLADELLVPVQAVVEAGGKYFCLQKNEGQWKALPVQVGATNDSFVVIREGLSENQSVVLDPRSHLAEIDLPELKGKEIQANSLLVGFKPIDPNAKPSPASAEGERGPGGGQGGGGQGSAAGMLSRLDTDGDGKLSEAELPEPMRPRFAAGDKNNDGYLDAAELSAMPRPQRNGGPNGPPGTARPIEGGGE